MDVAQELVEICDLLKQQQRRIIELDRSVRAALDVLKTQPHFFDSYQTTFRDLGSSAIILQEEQTLRDLDEKIRQLEVEREANITR